MLRRNRFLTGEMQRTSCRSKDVTWLDAGGEEMSAEHWDDGDTRCFGMLLDGRAPVSSIPQPGTDASLLLVFNAWHEGGGVHAAAAGRDGARGSRLFDTALEPQERATRSPPGDRYIVTGRSVLVLATASSWRSAGALKKLLGTI